MKSGNRGWEIAVMLLLTVVLFNPTRGMAQFQISTLAGAGDVAYNGEYLLASKININRATAAVADGNGNIYYADANNNRIRKISAGGIVTTIAGNGYNGYTPDGVKATEASIGQPTGIAIDNAGNIYFSEYINGCVRKINGRGVLITVAGNAVNGYSGNGGKATLAQLQGPSALAFDKDGNLYISDADNNCVRKVSTNGIITLYAGCAAGYGTGRGGYSGDGGKAVLAKLDQPGALVFDAVGNLYISDCFNHCIRKVTPAGIISTVAGSGKSGFSGDGGQAVKAQLAFPDGIAVDASGTLYIADHGNNRIRMINNNGIIITIAGSGAESVRGDDGMAALAAGVGKPSFVLLNNQGDLLIGDNVNNKIKIARDGSAGITKSAGSGAGNSHVSAGAMSASSGGGTQ